jgi:hypothetical protein
MLCRYSVCSACSTRTERVGLRSRAHSCTCAGSRRRPAAPRGLMTGTRARALCCAVLCCAVCVLRATELGEVAVRIRPLGRVIKRVGIECGPRTPERPLHCTALRNPTVRCSHQTSGHRPPHACIIHTTKGLQRRARAHTRKRTHTRARTRKHTHTRTRTQTASVAQLASTKPKAGPGSKARAAIR